jgi:hypothetical protein
MTDTFLGGRRIRLDPGSAIGKGGEADVYDLGDGRALKLFKQPAHPDLAGLPAEQAAARARLDEQQQKLPAFPAGLPAEVIAPVALATDRKTGAGAVVGYAMPLVAGAEPLARLADRSFRATLGTAGALALLRRLQATVASLHGRGVVVGDFNDQNVLLPPTALRAAPGGPPIPGGSPAIIDADSFQFGRWPCRVFTERFLDPLIADCGRPVAPFSDATDWYAFAALLCQSLLGVGPFGGIHRPRDPARRLAPSARPAARVTIFHPEVLYPKPAVPLAALPDDLLHALHLAFVEDLRGPLPERLFEAPFETCGSCGLEHGRRSCPVCAPSAGARTRTAAVLRGRLTARVLWEGPGRLLFAQPSEGAVRWCWTDGRALRREQGALVTSELPGPSARVRLDGERTLVGGDGRLRILEPGRAPRTESLDAPEAFDAREGRLVWCAAGQLLREGPHGPERLGDVLGGSTRLWLGGSHGFGQYEAGEVSVAFHFDPARRGLDDGLRLPRRAGRLLLSHALCEARRTWLFQRRVERGRDVHRCLLLDARGALLAEAEAEPGDGSWLGSSTGSGLAAAGACAAGELLFAPTERGLVRVEVRGAQLVETRAFPDTELFVDSGSALCLTRDGICAAGPTRLVALQLTP